MLPAADDSTSSQEVLIATRYTEWAETVERSLSSLNVSTSRSSDRDAPARMPYTFRGLLILVVGRGASAAARTVAGLRSSGRRCPMLVLSPDASGEAAAAVLEAGADDYLALPFQPRELVARVSALIRRSSGQWAATGAVAGIEFDNAERMVRIGRLEVKLTPTEFAIFRFLEECRGEWVTSTRIIQEVIGTHHAPRTALVRVHVHHIRRKLGACGWCIEAEHGRGYRLTL